MLGGHDNYIDKDETTKYMNNGTDNEYLEIQKKVQVEVRIEERFSDMNLKSGELTRFVRSLTLVIVKGATKMSYQLRRTAVLTVVQP